MKQERSVWGDQVAEGGLDSLSVRVEKRKKEVLMILKKTQMMIEGSREKQRSRDDHGVT